MENANINLYRTDTDSLFNCNFLLKAFSDTTTPKKNKPESASKWTFSIIKISLKNIRLRYDNEFGGLKNTFDVNHMKFSNLMFEATDLFYSGDLTQISIKKFSAIDQNQFSVTKLETEFSMDQHSIILKSLKATTTNSSIAADLNIHYSSLKSLKDSIQYLGLKLKLEDVSIKNADVLYFTPQLIKQPFFRNQANITTISGNVKWKGE